MKKVVAINLGCKLNFAEMASLLEELESRGWQQVKMGQPADLCLINTCAVTETAEQKDRQTIHRLVREYPDAFIAVTGCYAQLSPRQIADIPGVDLVLGADEKNLLLSCLEKGCSKVVGGATVMAGLRKDISNFLPACARGDRTRYFLKVQDGCDYFCSYCTVPNARGRSRNPQIATLVAQARAAAARGAREIVISGVNIGTFGRQHPHLAADGVAPRDVPAPSAASLGRESLLDLFRALDQVPGIERYRISSLEPDLLDDDIIGFVAHSRHFAPHFHLPLQSGSDEVLALMCRRYRRELFAEKVCRIKQAMPDAFIGVDVIVGMRGETQACFEDSEAFIRSLPVSQLHVFSYSERPGTRALDIEPKVSPADKKLRSQRLHGLSEEKRLEFYRSQLGRPMEVLFEHGSKNGRMSGFSANYVKVEVPFRADWQNTLQTLCPSAFNEDASALMLSEQSPV